MTMQRLNFGGGVLTVVTVVAAALWAFPLYWAIVTSIQTDYDVIAPGVRLVPASFTLSAYVHALVNTSIGRWYVNSIVTSVTITIVVVFMAACCGYAISQLRFPGRRPIFLLILASFMVPIQALMVTHFVLMADLGLVNTWAGVILPQLIAPVTVLIYKQFFDSVPKELREAAVIDGASEFHLLFRLYLPMNWGITVALAVISYISAWNSFLWPLLITTQERMMTITVGVIGVDDAFGVHYARDLAVAVLASLPVALAYLFFQRRVTQAIMLSAGIKG
jgi:multiple sugar transport system permease protein